MAGGSLFRPAIASLAVAGATATGPQVSLGTSPTFTFGIAGNTITGSAAGGAGGTVLTMFATGNTTQSSTGTSPVSSLIFRGEGIVSMGITGGSVVASATQSNQAVSGSNGSYTFQTLQFTNANGFSFVTTTAAGPSSFILGSYTVPTVTNSSWTVSDNATSGTVARLAFTNLNGVTLSLSSGAGGSHTIVGSHNALTSQSNQAASAANGSFAFQTISFSNLNGISFGTAAGSAITASHNGITSQSNQQITMFATGNTTQSSTGTTNASSLIFRGDGIASIGITNGSVVVSVPAGAPSPVNFSAGTTSNNLGSVVFSNSNGVSFGLNGSTITASVNAGGGGATISQWAPYDIGQVGGGGNQGQATLHLAPLTLMHAATFDRVALYISRANATNSTGSMTLSEWFGIYTRNVSTLSLLTSASGSVGISFHGTVSSYSLHGGPKLHTLGLSSSLSPGEYWAGIINRTTSGGANCTLNQMLVSHFTAAFSGIFNVASNATNQQGLGKGVYTASTTAMPGSVAFTQINGTASQVLRQPIFLLINGTI